MSEPHNKEMIGVILLNMGGPERLEEVEPFLFNLFSDRGIIRLSPFPFLQKTIARRIAKKRAPKSSESYRLIGGGSPLGKITADQGRALEKQLNEEIGAFKVRMAMRYWHPFAPETLKMFDQAGIKKIVVLTLYPHYSRATSGSSLEDLRRAAQSFGSSLKMIEIPSWPEHPGYIASLAETIRQGIKLFEDDTPQVVYSAHSLPVKFIEEGDPYLDHIRLTIAAVEKELGITGKLCFQSRSGPVRWLTPSTPDMLEELAGEGCRNILMVPISFVSDHVETLYEVDMQYRQLAEDLGMRLERAPALNTRPDFISCLKDLVLDASRKNHLMD